MGFLNFVFELPKRFRTARGPGPEAAPAESVVPLQGANALAVRRRSSHQQRPPAAGVASLITLPLRDAAAWRRQGALYARAGRPAEAIDCLRKALASGLESGGETAAAISDLGAAYRSLNDLAAAELCFREALKTYRRMGRQSGVSLQCANLGEVRAALGDWDGAEAWLQEGLCTDKARRCTAGMASHYNALGLAYLNRADPARGDMANAEVMFNKALELHEALGSPVGVAASCGALGVIYGSRGDLAQAETMLRRSLVLEEELGALENLAADYGNLGNIYRARGRLQKAEEMHRRALGCALQAGHKQHQATAYHNLGGVRLARGDVIEARVCLSLAVDLFREIGMAAQADEAEARLREAERPLRR
jgi:tetratricopeptide (TPR) repeat protein